MAKLLIFAVTAFLTLSFGSSSPLIRLPIIQGQGVGPRIDLGPSIKETINSLIQQNFSQPLTILPPNLPILIDIGTLLETITGEKSAITGSLTLNGLSVDISSTTVNDSIAELPSIIQPVNVSILGVAIPEVVVGGSYDLDIKVQNLIPIKGNGSYSLSVKGLYVALLNAILKIVGGIEFTSVGDYKLVIGAIEVNFQGIKVLGSEATHFVNKFINETLAVQTLPFLMRLLDSLHPVVQLLLKDVLNGLLQAVLNPGGLQEVLGESLQRIADHGILAK